MSTKNSQWRKSDTNVVVSHISHILIIIDIYGRFKLMSKKSVLTLVVFLVLGVVVTYVVAIVDALRRNSLLAGEAGLPFRFSSASLFGSESTNFLMLFTDVIFWSIVLWTVWKLFLKLLKR